MRRPWIGIAGCGGLGSNVAAHLIRSGADRLLLVDFDRIEPSNLNRQFYFADQVGLPKAETLAMNLHRINPSAELRFLDLKLDAANVREVFRDCGIVAEGFDRAESKAMLIEALLPEGKWMVSGSGLAGSCIEGIGLRAVGKNLHIVGDFSSDVSVERLFPPKISIVASWMAALILRELGWPESDT